MYSYCSAFFVNAVYLQLRRHRPHRLNHPFELPEILEFHICMERIFPLAARYREGLQLTQIDPSIRDLGQHPRQAAPRMIGMEIDRRLVRMSLNDRIFFPLQDKETGIVVPHRLNVGSQNVQPEKRGCPAARDCGSMPAATLRKMLRT